VLFGRQVQRHYGQIGALLWRVPTLPRLFAFHIHSQSSFCFLLGIQGVPKEDIIKRVADEWKALSNRERADWDEIARNDKLR
jgi:hypothetical protein